MVKDESWECTFFDFANKGPLGHFGGGVSNFSLKPTSFRPGNPPQIRVKVAFQYRYSTEIGEQNKRKYKNQDSNQCQEETFLKTTVKASCKMALTSTQTHQEWCYSLPLKTKRQNCGIKGVSLRKVSVFKDKNKSCGKNEKQIN